MQRTPQQAQLRRLFEESLDSEALDELIAAFESLSPAAAPEALDMGLILSDFSKKAAATYFKVLPQVLKHITVDELGAWVGLGIKVSQKTAAAGIRFFKEAPSLFAQITSPELRQRFIAHGLMLADADINLAVEYYRQAPTLLNRQNLNANDFSRWVKEGQALGRIDYGLAIEYFRITPELLSHLPMSLIPLWLSVGKQIAEVKLWSTLLFMRNGPSVLSAIDSDSSKEDLLLLCDEVARQAPLLAEQLFSDSPKILPRFQSHHLEQLLLNRATTIATFDAQLATTFFFTGPAILDAMGDAWDQFPTWVDEGIALLKKRSASAQSFFSLKGRAGHDAIDRLRGGLSLSSISRSLTLFAQALSGKNLRIQSTTKLNAFEQEDVEADNPDNTPAPKEKKLDAPTTDGETIFLPPHVRLFADNKLNFEWYKVATAYQSAYLEFDTYAPLLHETADLIEKLQHQYKRRGGFKSLTAFFNLVPEPQLIQRLFEIAEGARISFLLEAEYPGLRPALARMRETDLDRRPSLVGLSPRAVVLELLFQISSSGKTKEEIPTQLEKIVFDLCKMLATVQEKTASVASSMQCAATAFDYLYEGDEQPEALTGPMEAFDDPGIRTKGQGEESGEIRPSVQGAMDPARVEEALERKKQYTGALIEKLKEAGIELSSEESGAALSKAVESGEVSLEGLQKDETGELLEKLADDIKNESQETPGGSGKRHFFYDEWNCEEDRYQPRWCRVHESTVAQNSEAATEDLFQNNRGLIHSVTSAFQLLRPEGYLRIKGEREGDALDLDALLAARIETRLGQSPSDRIYIANRKKERSVAVALLVDMSGSTMQQLPGQEKSILQIEQEALILLAHAVDAVDDQLALYAFSGRGKEDVDFLILKDFDEVYNAKIDARIAQIAPAIQNRDGAAIRHATSKLARQSAKTKVLVVLSDGKPLDDGYRGSYATADTKMALKESKQQGIHPYCITVDKGGGEYLRGMYGDVAYTVIDDVARLPERLPHIYKTLTT